MVNLLFLVLLYCQAKIRVKSALFPHKLYDPGGHLKKCRSPGQEKCWKSASESAGPNGVPRVPSPMLPLYRRGARSTFFGTFFGTPFRTGTFRSTFSALFLAGASALLSMAARIVTQASVPFEPSNCRRRMLSQTSPQNPRLRPDRDGRKKRRSNTESTHALDTLVAPYRAILR